MFQFIKKRVEKHDERKRQAQEEIAQRVRAEQEVLAMTGGSAIPDTARVSGRYDKPPSWYLDQTRTQNQREREKEKEKRREGESAGGKGKGT